MKGDGGLLRSPQFRGTRFDHRKDQGSIPTEALMGGSAFGPRRDPTQDCSEGKTIRKTALDDSPSPRNQPDRIHSDPLNAELQFLITSTRGARSTDLVSRSLAPRPGG